MDENLKEIAIRARECLDLTNLMPDNGILSGTDVKALLSSILDDVLTIQNTLANWNYHV